MTALHAVNQRVRAAASRFNRGPGVTALTCGPDDPLLTASRGALVTGLAPPTPLAARSVVLPRYISL